MRARRVDSLAFAGAVGLHAVALLALRVALHEGPRAVVRAPMRSVPPPELGIEVELDALVGRAGPSPAGEPTPSIARNASSGSGAGRAARSNATPPLAALGDVDGAREPEAETEHAAPAGALATTPLDLGIGPEGWQRWVAAPNTTERESTARSEPRRNRFQVYEAPPVSTTGGLQEGLEKRDRELGLGPSGRVLSALHHAAHQSVAPQVGVARFEVKVLRSGSVEVTLASASGEVEGWRSVGKHIADDLRASPPRIVPPREGVKLMVELIAEETMPNGVRISSLQKPHLEVTPPKLQSVEKSVEDIAKDNPTTTDPKATLPPIKLDLPGIYLAERGKVCSYRLGVSAVGPVFQGGCDLSNLGAKPLRMVRARLLEENLF